MTNKDYSTKVGGRRKKAGSKTGSNNTAGNSSGYGPRRSFRSTKTTAVANQNKRFGQTRTRRGETHAV